MAEKWSDVKKEVDTYRDYVKGLAPAAVDQAKFCYLLTVDEFNRLLNLKGDGTLLDGVRIYLGAQEIGGQLISTVHAVAVQKVGDTFNDYNVPKEMPDDDTTDDLFGGGGGGQTGNLPPCPSICGNTNILNS